MKFDRQSIGLILMALAACLPGRAAAEEEPHQYEFGDIRIPAASADERVREELSVSAAVNYLEQGARAWHGARRCVSCHTNGTWMLVRPALSEALGPPPVELRQTAVAALKSLADMTSDELHRSTRPAQVIYVDAFAEYRPLALHHLQRNRVPDPGARSVRRSPRRGKSMTDRCHAAAARYSWCRSFRPHALSGPPQLPANPGREIL